MLDYGYIKNHCRLISIDLSRAKKLNIDPKAIQQIEFLGQLKKLHNDDNNNNNNIESMSVLTI